MNRRVFLKTLLLTAAAQSLPHAAMAGTLQGNLHPKSVCKNNRPESGKPPLKADKNDIITHAQDYFLLQSTVKRLDRMQRSVGHGNFALLNFDEALIHAHRDPHIGPFTSAEVDFLERIFYRDARRYGFMGENSIPF